MPRLALLALLATAGSFPLPQAAAQPRDLQARVQKELDGAREKAGFPGATAAVVMPDGTVLSAASGFADAAGTMPLTSAARMPGGSVGKTFVAAAVLQAVDDKVLNLDAPIVRYIGSQPWYTKIPNAQSLTLRLLLSHRSGLPDALEAEFLRAVTTDVDRRWTPPELAAFVFDMKPRAEAGRKFYYTDMNYVIAGAIFEHVTRSTLFGEIGRRILVPFDLSNTVPSERRDFRDVVSGRLDPRGPLSRVGISGESVRNGRLVYNAQAEYAGGGLISTSTDLARWAKLLWEGRAFSAPLLNEMLAALPSEGGARHGLGVEVSSSGAGPVYGHSGWIFGYQTVMVYFPDLKVAGAIQINSDPMRAYKMQPGDVLGHVVSLVIRELRSK